MSENQNQTVPKRWIWANVSDIGEVVTGNTPNKSIKEFYGNDFPFYKPTDLNAGYYVKKSVDSLSKKGIERARYLPSKSILVTCIGATIGKTGFIRKGGASNQQINAIIPSVLIYPEFVYYLCISPEFQKSIINKASSTTLPILNKSKFESLRVSIPPLPEQHRIVAKIEELFTRLDAGVAALQQIKKQLKRYRQAVLKAAFEGKLTAEWREQNSPLRRGDGGDVEPASKLLERILKERREKWEAEQLQKMKSNGKTPKDDSWKQKYKEPKLPHTSDLPELPEGWVWVTVDVVKNRLQYGTSEKASEDSNGIPVLRMGNIQDGELNFDNLKYMPQNWSEIDNFLLQDGDVLFNRTNSAELVGKTAVYKQHHPKSVFASYLIRIILGHNHYNPILLSHFINSIFGRRYIKSVVSQQVGQANVNGTKLSQMPIPLLSFKEQIKIVEEIERSFSIADQIEATIEQSLKQAENLRQSILKKAFAGKLVLQDPNDEPAEKLLERIKAEKTKHP